MKAMTEQARPRIVASLSPRRERHQSVISSANLGFSDWMDPLDLGSGKQDQSILDPEFRRHKREALKIDFPRNDEPVLLLAKTLTIHTMKSQE